MNMRKFGSVAWVAGVSLMSVLSAPAAPHVDTEDVTITQAPSRLVTVAYTLEDEPAVVTMEIQTNTLDKAAGDWVTVPELCDFKGDVNRRVDVGSRTITWNPVEEWPGKAIRNGKVRALVTAWPTNNPPDVVLVDLPTGDVSFFRSLEALPGGPTSDVYKVNKLVMKRCHAAGVLFRMGATDREENARHTKSGGYEFERSRMGMLSADFYLGLYEFTAGQYAALTSGSDQSLTTENRLPKLDRTWNNLRGDMASGAANDWPSKGHAVAETSDMGRLRARVGGSLEFDLPTSSQWEFACRAGSQLPYSNGARYFAPTQPSDASAPRYKRGRDASWNSGNTSALKPVGTVASVQGTSDAEEWPVNPFNAWGFADMLGNARELVLDRMNNYLTLADFENGPAVSGGHQYMSANSHVIRGGSFAQDGSYCRASSISDWGDHTGRGDRAGESGFRVCMPAVVQ